MARIFEEAGLPPGVLQMLPGGKDVGEAMVTDPHVRVISFTGSTAVGRSIGELAGPPPQARAPRARRQLGAADPRRRGRREGGGADRLGVVPQPGPDLHDHRPLLRRRRHLRRLRRRSWPRRPATCRSATRPPSRSRSARSSTRVSATRSTAWSPRASTRAPGWPRAASTTGSSTGRPCSPRSRSTSPVFTRGGLRPGRAGHPGLVGRRRGRGWRPRATTGSRSASSPGT